MVAYLISLHQARSKATVSAIVTWVQDLISAKGGLAREVIRVHRAASTRSTRHDALEAVEQVSLHEYGNAAV